MVLRYLTECFLSKYVWQIPTAEGVLLKQWLQIYGVEDMHCEVVACDSCVIKKKFDMPGGSS